MENSSDLKELIVTLKDIVDDSFFQSESNSKAAKAKIRKNMQAIKKISDLIRTKAFDKNPDNFKIPNYLTSIINKKSVEKNAIKTIKEPVFVIQPETIFKDFMIKYHEAINRTNTIISQKLKTLMFCYSIINFKRNDYTFSFQKKHIIKGKVYTDPKVYEGIFEIIEREEESDCTLRLIITKY